MKKRILCVPVIAVVLAAVAELSPAQTPAGTAFTYQGQLKQGGLPTQGTYQLQFKLYDADGNLLATYPPSGTVATPRVPRPSTGNLDFSFSSFPCFAALTSV